MFMTPEAVQYLIALREKFYSGFQTQLRINLNTDKKNTHLFNPSFQSIATWIDRRQRMNFMTVYALQAPDVLFPERSLILRIVFNCKSASSAAILEKKIGMKLNQDWSLELTLLPTELLNIIPWLVQWIEAQEGGITVRDFPNRFVHLPILQANSHLLWTSEAWRQAERECLPLGDRKVA
jgi:hypothetical protein